MPNIHDHPQARIRAARMIGAAAAKPSRSLADHLIAVAIGTLALLTAVVLLAVIGAAYVVALAVVAVRTPQVWLAVLVVAVLARLAGWW